MTHISDAYVEAFKQNNKEKPSKPIEGKRRDDVSRRLKKIAQEYVITDVYYDYEIEYEGGLTIEYHTANTKRILVIGYSEMGQWIALDKRIKNNWIMAKKPRKPRKPKPYKP